ncbi:hypothetical protein PACTADRAFT_82029 [Pachysolen tannophilus NRRL Y-2460]|uniref:t-SNARE coiled-coil homology domain-containing protein n=1 Tax=Pachysolen tannophilus NRRL Y-2460 TaxID=669874 RepID=A0A1E4TRS6_PACTA|nr:hypothetical protein PACTADRAFT_82029 [Pachysolen tannophilus NRRL Y-2460]
MSESSLFNSYEADFKLSFNEAQTKLSSISELDGEPRRLAMRDVEKSMDECYEIIDQMNIEIQNISTQHRSTYNSKLRTYQKDTDYLKQSLKKLMDDEDKRNLFGSNYYRDGGVSGNLADDQRQALLSNNASLERSSERLRDSSRIALETEDIGANILNDLRSQREQITNSRNTLSEADNYVDKSIKTIKTMTRRMAANKLITYAIIAVLILLIVLVLISKFW